MNQDFFSFPEDKIIYIYRSIIYIRNKYKKKWNIGPARVLRTHLSLQSDVQGKFAFLHIQSKNAKNLYISSENNRSET